MAAIFIESDNVKSLKLLTEMAEQLGVTVNKLSAPQAKELNMVAPAKKNKTGKKSTPGKAGNTFLNLRNRITTKMTEKQIDKQLKSLRLEWQRDI